MVTNGLNYTTNYYHSLNDSPLEFNNWVCFSSLYNKTSRMPSYPNVKGNIGIKVYFSKELNKLYYDNYCLLNEDELSEYIEWIKKITKFNIKISDKIQITDKIDNYDHKILTVKFTKKYPYETRLICASIRSLYECPYNLMIKTAFLMKSHEEFSNLDFTERFCIAINSISGYNTTHSIFYYYGVDLYNDKSLRKGYCQKIGRELNVQNFMLKDSENENYSRIYYSKDSNNNIFNNIENNKIIDNFKKVLITNYKITKKIWTIE